MCEQTLMRWYYRWALGGDLVSGVCSVVRTSVNQSYLLSSRLTASPWAAGPRMDY